MNSGVKGLVAKILLIENDLNNVQIIKKLIGEDFCYEQVDTTENAFEYLEDNTNETALIMLNVEENKKESFDFIHELEKGDLLEYIPVIAMANNPSEMDLIMAYEHGCADFMNLKSIHTSSSKRVRNTILVYMQARIRELAQSELDSLTETLNFAALRRRFEEINRNNKDKKLVIIYSDIKNFKYFNQAFGFEAGNELLRYWCETIRKYSEEEDLLSRVSGDRVILVIPEKEGGMKPEIADKVLNDVKNHFAKKFADYTINIISGMYIYDPAAKRGETFDEMIGYAREAQHTIKHKESSGWAFFDDEMWKTRQKRIEINGRIDQAIAEKEILVYFQPQYNSVTRELIGAECLARWNHKTMGMISPADFIPALEESGKIFDLDKYIWEEACKYIKEWSDKGKQIRLSVNVSRKDIEYGDLPEIFTNLVNKYEISPTMLHIEITETAYMDDAHRLTGLVKDFTERGFIVEMDDFGSGFSSLNLLHEVEVGVLKLDMGFLKGSDENVKSGSIIGSIVRMAHVLDINVLAEGVETAAQAEFLKNIGCLLAQGYFFSKPIPKEEFERLLFGGNVGLIIRGKEKYQAFNLQELFDKKSSGFFLFNNCMGPAAFFEIFEDVPQPIVVNDEFLSLLDMEREEVERNRKDFFVSVPEDKREKLLMLAKLGAKHGKCSGEIFFEELGKHIFIYMRFVADIDGRKTLFCELTDITKEKELEKEKLQKYWYEQKLKLILETPNIVLYDYDPYTDEMSLSMRKENGEMYERKGAEYLKRLPERLWIEKDSLEEYTKTLLDVSTNGGTGSVVAKALYKDGSYKLTEYHFMAVQDEYGRIIKVLGRAQKVEDKMDEKLLDMMPVGTFRYLADGKQEFDYVGRNLLAMLGFGSEEEFREFYNNSFLNFVHPEDRDRVIKEIDNQISVSNTDYCEYRVIAADGSIKWLFDRGTLVIDEHGIKRYYVAVSDMSAYKEEQLRKVTEHKKLVQELQMSTRRDSMTKLLNHEYSIGLIRMAINEAESGILMMMDIDRFKWINDNLGHLAGDKALCDFSKILKKQFRDEDIVGRYGGDEFICFISGSDKKSVAERKAKSILKKAENIMIDDTMKMSVSIGIAIRKVGDKTSVEELIKSADEALYTAKKLGKVDSEK